MNTLASKIRALRKARDMKQAEFGAALGVDQSTVSRWEKGTQEPNYMQRTALARMAGEDINDFMTPETAGRHGPGQELAPVRVIGAVEAGRLVEAIEWPGDEQFNIRVPQDPRYPEVQRQAFVVRGPSMNRVLAPGSLVICVSPFEVLRDPVPGEYVVVRQMTREGMIELTLKEYQVDDDGHRWLWPRSTHPLHQSPIKLHAPEIDENSDDILVVGIVVGSYRLEGPAIPPPPKNGR